MTSTSKAMAAMLVREEWGPTRAAGRAHEQRPVGSVERRLRVRKEQRLIGTEALGRVRAKNHVALTNRRGQVRIEIGIRP
jgi:hypothetical protein